MKHTGFCPMTKEQCREDCMWLMKFAERSKKYDTCAFAEIAVQLEFISCQMEDVNEEP